MDGHAAVEGQGWRWLSSAPPPLCTSSTNTQTVKDKDIRGIIMIIRKTLLLDMGGYSNSAVYVWMDSSLLKIYIIYMK